MGQAERGAAQQAVWEGSDSAKRVLGERYLLRKNGQVVETPEELFMRVARAIARVEAKWGRAPEAVNEVAEAFCNLMVTNRFMPNSPTLMNAGKDNGLQYSACYVLPVEDSIEGIFRSVHHAAQIHQSGGGTGFSFSRLRPKDAEVKSTGGRASGPVSFLRVFNAATEAVKQGGTRRGANMGILRVDHPDILEFIHCKRDLDENNEILYKLVEPVVPENMRERVKRSLVDRQIANFNISVAITDPFMKALADDKEYDLIAPNNRQVVKRLRAREVFDQIVRCAWETGDPGLVFIDRVNAGPANPTPDLCVVEATNPCGEQPLYPNEACNLGSINLARFVAGEGKRATVNWDALRQTVHLCIRFLDDVIEANPYPLAEIDKCVKDNRRVGLGVMGWADMLMLLGTPYDSTEAVDLGGKVMKFINDAGHEASHLLAKERGTFPNWPNSIYKSGRPLRNSTVTTIAPTGTISIIAGCSSGIEPIFALAFQHVAGERRLTFVNPIFEEVAKNGGWLTPELREEILKHGAVRGVDGVPEEIQHAFPIAHEVAPDWHVQHQGAFQKHTDNGVSKTINLPNNATMEDVRKAYLKAYDLGCLGITVYRDGCKGVQVLTAGVKEAEAAPGAATAGATPVASPAGGRGGVKPRPHKVRGTTSVIRTPVGSAFVTINEDDSGEPLEVFVTVGKSGSDIIADAEAIGRLISFALRTQAVLPARERLLRIAMQLEGIGGSRSTGYGPERVRSLGDGVARVIFDYLGTKAGGTGTAVGERPAGTMKSGSARDLCPTCGNATLALEEGCKKCHSCGYSEC
ncbi:MAG: adenosylcobalamin-dependent ribonucleoside-diphosphate reductase [Candidatus Coatesbacteria bacterium]